MTAIEQIVFLTNLTKTGNQSSNTNQDLTWHEKERGLETIFKRIRGIKDQDLSFLGPMISEKGSRIPSFLEHSHSASLVKFKKRDGLFQKTVCNESADVLVTICENWSFKATEITQQNLTKKNLLLTTEIFEKWLKALDKQMRKWPRKISLLIDNCLADL